METLAPSDPAPTCHDVDTGLCADSRMLRPLNILGLDFDMLEQFCSVLMGEANGRHGQPPEAFNTACQRCSECAKNA